MTAMDRATFERLAAMDPAQRSAWVDDLLVGVERPAPWQRAILRKRVEELRPSLDDHGAWDRPAAWLPAEQL